MSPEDPAPADGSVRRILHCDMDCFYAAVHMRDDPTLQGRPVVIGGSPEGRGVVAAASYEARRFGIRSAMPAARALRLCPEAVFLKSDFSRYREESGRIFEIYRRFTPLIQPVSIDEAYLDVTEHLAPWGHATAVAGEIKRLVLEERGLTVSVGVAPNRLVAKIASDFDKPDGLTVVSPRRVQIFLDPLSVRVLPGVGPATGGRLAERGIDTVADLRAWPVDHLVRDFGRHGRTLYRYARGMDERPVRVSRTRKSLGHERTYARDLERIEEMEAEIERLSERVAAGLSKKGFRARTVTLKVRYGDFTTLTRATSLGTPTDSSVTIALLARRLLAKTEAGKRSVRLLGVSTTHLVRGGAVQMDLLAEPPEPPEPPIGS